MTAERGDLPVVAPLSVIQYEHLVRRELQADLGSAGDITTHAIVKSDVAAMARVVARHPGRVCGLECAVFAFRLLGGVRHRVEHRDGADVEAGTTLVELEGSAHSLLAAERTALNLLGHLSGIASVTRDLVREVGEAGHARVVCTRKTTPGLRALEISFLNSFRLLFITIPYQLPKLDC